MTALLLATTKVRDAQAAQNANQETVSARAPSHFRRDNCFILRDDAACRLLSHVLSVNGLPSIRCSLHRLLPFEQARFWVGLCLFRIAGQRRHRAAGPPARRDRRRVRRCGGGADQPRGFGRLLAAQVGCCVCWLRGLCDALAVRRLLASPRDSSLVLCIASLASMHRRLLRFVERFACMHDVDAIMGLLFFWLFAALCTRPPRFCWRRLRRASGPATPRYRCVSCSLCCVGEDCSESRHACCCVDRCLGNLVYRFPFVHCHAMQRTRVEPV